MKRDLPQGRKGSVCVLFFFAARHERDRRGLPLPGTAGRETRFLSHTIAAYWMMRSIGFVATHICGTTNVERRNAGQRYGRNTARGEASPSTCAAMVRAWPRQRRNSSTRSQCRRDQRTHAADVLQAEFSGPCPPLPARAGVFWLQTVSY